MQSSDETTRSILGIDVLLTTSPKLVSRIDDAIQNGTPLRLAFLNANLANVASSDPRLSQGLRKFLVVNDGVGVDMASRLLYGSPFLENLNGTDFTPLFLDKSRHNLRLFLLGSRPEVVSQAVRLFSDRWPRHTVVGARDGFFSQDDEPAIAAEIKASAPDIVLVAMGNPRQEMWIAKHVPETCRCAFAVGAVFDFLTGNVDRAPEWLRGLRSEWIFRLALEPRRLWRRYLVGNLAFLNRVLSQKFRDQS